MPTIRNYQFWLDLSKKHSSFWVSKLSL